MLATPLEWQADVIRAAITLKLCVHEETGAIVAALTTSIPEAPNSGRNWDYRYCWLRDAYYTVQALNRFGAADILEGYLGYLRNIIDATPSGRIQPLYGVGMEPILQEAEDHFAAGLSRHGAGTRRQPGARTPSTRRLRPDRAIQRSGLLRHTPVSPS
jgi:GH15 family glucan-1,4-alpha-glucosidase